MKRWLMGIALATAACGAPTRVSGGAEHESAQVGGVPSASATATPTDTVQGQGPTGEGMCTTEQPACTKNEPEKTSIGAGGPSVTGKLPPEVIARTVRASIAQVRSCYERGLKKDPGLKGTVKIKFTIAADGKVSNAQDDGSQLPSAEVVECVRAEIRKITFPAPEGGSVTVVYPFAFEANP